MSLITYFCDYGRVKSVVPEFLWQVFLTSLVALPSQFFFTYRVSKFSGKRWLFLVLLAPAAAFELVGGLAFIALGTITPTTEALVSFTPASVFTAVQGTAAAVDIANAAGLVYLLSQNWGGALPKSRNILQSLVILTINTGIWTALFAIFTLITIVVYKGDLIYAALYFPLCPLYCNTVLANLNARTFISSHPGFGDGDTLNPGLVFVQPGRTSTVVQPGIGVIDPTLATSEGSSEDTRNEYHVDRPFLTAESDRGESQEIGRDSPM
ncbi:hypothetical protein BV22DRAFT_1131940 [Leucogyrophana mollusca]|uniref:Uncharacterized protein n=1 Tax=Leucogyrophana mollusca TaxID=85980 RepID=A0ACB8B8E4_9AGAM|nr:hypothetical protein BV22DRAFT_1131940 [Leucogyrophana mollusca]